MIAYVIILGAAVLGIAIWSIISWQKQSGDYNNENFTEPEPESINAEVVFKYTDIERGGSYKFPRHNVVFKVTFLTEDNRTIEYKVTPEIYNRCEINAKGLLITLNGNFFDFGDGEDISL